jgi:putative ABC transport system substrate-binding protein
MIAGRVTLSITLALGVLFSPLAAAAQQAGRVPRIGILSVVGPTSARGPEEVLRGLRELGYREGENIVVEYRAADNRPDRLPQLASELVRLKVDVIVAFSTIAARPAKAATKTIPIVTVTGDPVGTGLVASLARPGGNVTGVSLSSPDLTGKRLELLKQVVQRLARVAVLWNPEGPVKVREFEETRVAAQALGLKLHSVEVWASKPDFEAAFAATRTAHAEALLTLGNPLTSGHLRKIVQLATLHRLPSMFDGREFVDGGGLISYGPNVAESFRRMAWYVDRILKGARPGDLPIEQPTKFELVINVKTAKALGLTIPSSLLFQADHVVE